MIITDIQKLKIQSEDVKEDEANSLINELQLALDLSAKNGTPGIGLSAPQIGINKKAAIVRIDNMKIDLINSNITEQFDKMVSVEGCLSLPGQTCKVERYNQVVINNMFATHKRLCAYGLVSVCVQHEMDHWDGILMTDREIKNVINIGPNQPCPCGKVDIKTGKHKKYKKCCGRKQNG